MIRPFSDYVKNGEPINEKLRHQADLILLKAVVKANDVEVKVIPKQGTETIVKIRALSVDKSKVFSMHVVDIELFTTSQSINVDF